jgi:hypothetical protein
MRSIARAVLLCALSLATECSGSSSSSGGPNGDAGTADGQAAEAACTELAQVGCQKRQACTNTVYPEGALIVHNFGDMNTCVERQKASCLAGLQAPGTGSSPNAIGACVTAFAGWSCTDLLDNVPPDACVIKGSRADGQPCAFNGQCATGFCSGIKYATCGTCAEFPSAGASCAASDCGHNQLCVATTNLCQTRGVAGATCDPQTAPCAAGLSCAGATGSQTCQTAASTVGAACGNGTPACFAVQELACSGPNQQKTCAAITFVDASAACGLMADGSHADCRAGNCYTNAGPATAADLGTCKSDAADGRACDTQLGPSCIAPARCVVAGTGTTGTCRFPDAAACS